MRGRKNEAATTPTVPMRRATARRVHANPIRGSSCRTSSGYTTPPTLAPEAASPMARLRRRAKYVLISAMAGVNCIPLPRPCSTPCVSSSAGYEPGQKLAPSTPASWRASPRRKAAWKRPASRARPERAPRRKRRAICRLPIQEIVLGGREGRVAA
jgi:hypothetical protein